MSRIRLILLNFGLLCLAATFMSYNSNPPEGKTGAPGESTCSDCHSGGSSTGNVEILGLPSVINAKEFYNINVKITKTGGNATKAGFQLVALNAANQNAGYLLTLASDHGTNSENGREYVEHRNGKAFVNNVAEWTFKWQAPDAPDSSNITMYAVGNICNGNNNTSGDKVVKVNATGKLKVKSTSTNDLISHGWNLYPNPSKDFLYLQRPTDNTQPVSWQVFDINGSLLKSGESNSILGDIPIEVSTFVIGQYFLRLNSGTDSYYSKFVKL